MKKENASLFNPKLIAIIAGALSALLGLLVITGWYTHNVTLLQIHPTFVAMVFNTALGFLLCDSALVLIVLEKPRLAAIGGSYALIAGLLTFSEFVFGADFGIDQLLMRHYIQIANQYPGRMAINTTVFFSLFGAAILIRSLSRPFKHRALLLGIAGSMLIAQGMVGFTGYLTGITTTLSKTVKN